MALLAVRKEFFLAVDADLTVEILEAAGDFPTATVSLDEFGATFAATGAERGGNVACVLNLIVAVLGVAAA